MNTASGFAISYLLCSHPETMAASFAPAGSQTHVGVWIELLSPSSCRAKALAGTTRRSVVPSHPDPKMRGASGRHPVRVIVHTGQNLSARASGRDEVPGAC